MRRAVVPLLLALVLLAPASLGASPEGAASGWRTVLVIDSATAQPQKAFEAFDTASLNLYDFDGDGDLEIVSNNDNNRAYVLDSRTGRVLAEIMTTYPGGASWPVRDLNAIAIGDLYGNGVPCMVIPNSAAYMSAWCFDGAASTPTSFAFVKKWDVKVDPTLYQPDFKAKHPWMYYESNGTIRPQYELGLDGNAFLSDVDGDGTLEVFVETDGFPGQMAFNHDGSFRWIQTYWDGNAGGIVADIDKDGVKEAVFASDSGSITAYNAKNGGIEWTFDISANGAWPGSIPVPPLVADLDGDGTKEVVFGARNIWPDQSNPNWINISHAIYTALDSRGDIRWSVTYDWMNPLQYNHPAAVDVNGDGTLDVVFLDWNTVGHKPGKWNTTNRPANLFALNGRDGSVLWHTPIVVYWSNKDFAIVDADNDGALDIIAPTARWGADGIGVYHLGTGERKGWYPVAEPWQLSRGPVTGNLYGDGKLYVVVPVAKRAEGEPYRWLDVGWRMGALHIIETGATYKAAFSANIRNTDSLPTDVPVATPPPSTSPPTPTVTPPPGPTPTTSPTLPVATPNPTASPPPTTTPAPARRGDPAESTEVPAPAIALALATVAAVAVLTRGRRT